MPGPGDKDQMHLNIPTRASCKPTPLHHLPGARQVCSPLWVASKAGLAGAFRNTGLRAERAEVTRVDKSVQELLCLGGASPRLSPARGPAPSAPAHPAQLAQGPCLYPLPHTPLNQATPWADDGGEQPLWWERGRRLNANAG